ncbi:cytokinin dehydrogenase 3-like [Abeliophyllum distichum]|uniref:Cytokinin dehydrogenase 3-like n=1 Tax=Abeliophyllum distichum TaxID=126358 RepID=A0ABD1QKN9_9LAMI
MRTGGYQYIYKQVQPKEDPQSGSSSGPKRNVIIQNSRKITVNEGHTKTVRIQPNEDDEIPLSSKEEEYKNFAKVIYELKFSDSYFISPGEHIYPRVIMMKGAYPLMVKMAADYRFLDLIYPDKTLEKFEKFDDILKSEISKYAQGRSIYLKFYTISLEVEDEILYLAEHIITIGHVGRNFIMDVGENDKPIPKHINHKKSMRSKRLPHMLAKQKLKRKDTKNSKGDDLSG